MVLDVLIGSNFVVDFCSMGSIVRQLIFGDHSSLDTIMGVVKEDVFMLVS